MYQKRNVYRPVAASPQTAEYFPSYTICLSHNLSAHVGWVSIRFISFRKEQQQKDESAFVYFGGDNLLLL